MRIRRLVRQDRDECSMASTEMERFEQPDCAVLVHDCFDRLNHVWKIPSAEFRASGEAPSDSEPSEAEAVASVRPGCPLEIEQPT